MAEDEAIHGWLVRHFTPGSPLNEAGLQAVGWNPGDRVLLWVLPGRRNAVVALLQDRFPDAVVDVAEGKVRGTS